MSNQTQSDVEGAALLVCHDWMSSGERTLERLYGLADERAARKELPKVMVRSTALQLLRQRVPEILPAGMRDLKE